jgi:hypothetical protein
VSNQQSAGEGQFAIGAATASGGFVHEDVLKVAAPSAKHVLTKWPLAVIIFYSVSGGPFGVEECVRAGGPMAALLGFLIAPFIWSFQESRVTAELASAFPHASGGVIWCGTCKKKYKKIH